MGDRRRRKGKLVLQKNQSGMIHNFYQMFCQFRFWPVSSSEHPTVSVVRFFANRDIHKEKSHGCSRQNTNYGFI